MTLRESLQALVLVCALAALQAGAQQYAFHVDGQEAGLDSLTVNCMLQDKTGFIWVCTENGLYRFDGTSYARVGHLQGLDDSFIVAIHQDTAGELWVATINNLYRGDGKQFKLVITAAHGLNIGLGQQVDSIDGNHVLLVSHNTLLQVTRAGVADTWASTPFFSESVLASHPELKTIHSVFVTPDGSVWMGCAKSICEVQHDRVRVLGSSDGIANDEWTSFLQDSVGRIWGRGIHHLVSLEADGSHVVDRDIPSASLSIANGLLPLTEDQQHRVLTRTDQGLAIWDHDRWRLIGVANGLLTPGIRSLLVDRDGALWLGTYGKGAQRWLGYGSWETWATGQGLPDAPVWSMLRDKGGDFWATTESGVVEFDRAREHFTPWLPFDKTPAMTQVVSVTQWSDGSLWFLSGMGKLIHYSPKTGARHAFDVPINNRDLWIDSSDRLWILGFNGLYQFDPISSRTTHIEDPAVPDVPFDAVCEHRGELWFASRAGLVHFAHDRWTDVRGSATTATDGFASIACASDGTLWLGGTSTGVRHLRIQNEVAVPADPGAPADMDSVEAMFLRFDRRGWLWVGSGSGVYVFNGSQWRHITQRDGLAWDDCSEGAFFEDSDGSIWIGTSNGLAHLLRPADIFLSQPLRLTVSSATLGDATLPASSFATFPWTREPLRVHVATSRMSDQSSMIYKYRLAGLDKEWATSRSQDLQFSSLAAGTYRLEMFAEDTDRGDRSPPTVLRFRLHPPWWKGLYFQIAMLALLGLLMWGLVRFRDGRLVAHHAELEALVKVRTKELELEKKQLEEAREALREQASRDALTGLFNRGAIHEMLTREMARIRRERSILTLVMIDIDHFKLVNDRYGHIAGDEVLREVSGRLTDAIRPYDAVGRLGGEEFLLVMPEFDAGLDLTRLGMVHNSICGTPVSVPGGDLTITCSFGVSVLFSDQAITPEQLLDRADKALYKAKRAGRNRIEFDLPAELS